MPRPVSIDFRTFSFAIGAQKLGHPVPDSNLVSELNNALLQQMPRCRPLSRKLKYSPVNALSVPSLRAPQTAMESFAASIRRRSYVPS